MPGILHSNRRRQAGKIALFLLLAGASSAAFPKAVPALGGPWPITVSVEGEVRRPGTYTLPHNATLSSLILAASGFTDNADLRGAALVRISARTAQEAELKSTAGRLAAETGGSEEAGNALRPVVALLLELRTSGRVPIRAAHPRLLKHSPDDLRLEEGDALRVPARVDSVTVAGAVAGTVAGAEGAGGGNASVRVPFSPGLPLAEYVRRAGGYAADADRDRVYLLRADGTTALLTPGFISWNTAASRWEVTALAGSLPGIDPGDAIVVPRHPPDGLPRKTARRIPPLLMRAAEITGMPVLLPGAPPERP